MWRMDSRVWGLLIVVLAVCIQGSYGAENRGKAAVPPLPDKGMGSGWRVTRLRPPKSPQPGKGTLIPVGVDEKKYREAVELLLACDFEKAAKAFTALRESSDQKKTVERLDGLIEACRKGEEELRPLLLIRKPRDAKKNLARSHKLYLKHHDGDLGYPAYRAYRHVKGLLWSTVADFEFGQLPKPGNFVLGGRPYFTTTPVKEGRHCRALYFDRNSFESIAGWRAGVDWRPYRRISFWICGKGPVVRRPLTFVIESRLNSGSHALSSTIAVTTKWRRVTLDLKRQFRITSPYGEPAAPTKSKSSDLLSLVNGVMLVDVWGNPVTGQVYVDDVVLQR